MTPSKLQVSTRTAFVLAGGLGTRLRSVVSDVPKPMAPVNGRPFLDYLLHYWQGQGISDFILSVGYLSEVITDYFGTSHAGASIRYVQEPSPLGTGGALALAEREGMLREDEVLLLNGDTWFEASLPALEQDAAAHPHAAMVLTLLKIPRNTRYGSVHVDGQGLITSFGEKTDAPDLINAGCCLLRTREFARSLAGMPEVFSLEKDLLPRLAAAGRLGASIQDAPFIDIGIPEDYERMQRKAASSGLPR